MTSQFVVEKQTEEMSNVMTNNVPKKNKNIEQKSVIKLFN